MSRKSLKSSALVAVIAGCVFLPRPTAAQAARTQSAPAPTPAYELESRARAWLDEPKKWPEVARLLEQAAQVRSADDPRGVDDLIIAAAAYRWAGKRSAARATYVAAAERALALGDVVRAADAFLYAAMIANAQKDAAAAWELKERAERLAQSPLLTVAQRELIVGRFAVPPKYARSR